MKRSNRLVLVRFAASVLFPAIHLLTGLSQFSLRIENGLLYAGITTAVYDLAGLLLLLNKDRRIGKAQAALLAVTLLLNQVNILLFLIFAENMPAKLLLASWFVMTAVLVAFYVKSVGLKVAFYVLSGLLVLPVCFLILMSDFGAETVLAREISPDQTYCAEVIDDDQGALGGATILEVYRYDESFSIGSFEFRKNIRTIYYGRWGEYESLYWIDNDHLSMNGRTYSMSDFY